MDKIAHFFEAILYAVLLAVCLLLWLSLGGCAAQPATRVEYVRVQPQEPPVVQRPELEITRLKQGDDASTVIQSHRITIQQLIGYAQQLETILDGYRTKK